MCSISFEACLFISLTPLVMCVSLSFLKSYLLYMYRMLAFMYICVPHDCLVPTGAGTAM